MLRLLVKSCSYSITVDGGSPTRQVSALAAIPEGIDVHGSKFSGPVHVVISDKSVDPPFQHGSIYWGADASAKPFAALWVFAPAQIVDRVADKASTLQQINVSAAGVLVNGGTWPDPKDPAAVSTFSCIFGHEPAA
ncbi:MULTISPECIES: hypothetical protein [Xanthomonas]|jgi:hypothetical protein|uniref:DUF3455 domain-containing protein n=1 Tax=Xanthomonas arboricola TaxID=56448 RepID=A0AB73H200_9XANT|nr:MULTISPECIES: hypothetical protein [Xanthomonas]MBB5671469.1 hypothetical protein [Xanthomonas arboricola]